MIYANQDTDLALQLIKNLLKFWPFANSTKEVMFLSELLEILEICEIEKLESLVKNIFKRITKCIAGQNIEISNKAQGFFANNYFKSIVKTYRHISFPIIVPIVE